MHGVVTTWTQCVLQVLVSDQWHFWLVRHLWVGQPNPLRHSFWNLQTSAIAISISSLVSCFFVFFKSNIQTCRCLWSLPRCCVRMCACVLCYDVCDVDCWRKSAWTYPGMMVYRCRRKCEMTRSSSHTFGLAHCLFFFFFLFFFLWGLVRRYRFLIYFKQADVLTLFFFFLYTMLPSLAGRPFSFTLLNTNF